MSDSRPRMSRGSRVARGSGGALAATLLAALSHGLAGGTITWLSVIATALVALPLCTGLAGRIGSLWRMAVAVFGAQFLYHWSFSGLGIASSAASSNSPAPVNDLHASHLAALQQFVPSAAADTTMWTFHILAAILTTTMLYRGERAFLALIRLIHRVMLPTSSSPAPALPLRGAIGVTLSISNRLNPRLFSPAAITHRGPPLSV